MQLPHAIRTEVARNRVAGRQFWSLRRRRHCAGVRPPCDVLSICAPFDTARGLRYHSHYLAIVPEDADDNRPANARHHPSFKEDDVFSRPGMPSSIAAS